MVPAQDSSAGNVQRCSAGASGFYGKASGGDWLLTMERGETVAEGVATGTCAMHAAAELDGDVGSSSAPTDTETLLVRPQRPGDDCAYFTPASTTPDARRGAVEKKESAPFALGAAMGTTAAHGTDTCCKACAADPRCAAARYLPPTAAALAFEAAAAAWGAGGAPRPANHPGPGPQPGECFGLHVTSIPGHATSPGLQVQEVEAAFTAKVRREWSVGSSFRVAANTSPAASCLLRYPSVRFLFAQPCSPLAQSKSCLPSFIRSFIHSFIPAFSALPLLAFPCLSLPALPALHAWNAPCTPCTPAMA